MHLSQNSVTSDKKGLLLLSVFSWGSWLEFQQRFYQVLKWRQTPLWFSPCLEKRHIFSLWVLRDDYFAFGLISFHHTGRMAKIHFFYLASPITRTKIFLFFLVIKSWGSREIFQSPGASALWKLSSMMRSMQCNENWHLGDSPTIAPSQ